MSVNLVLKEVRLTYEKILCGYSASNWIFGDATTTKCSEILQSFLDDPAVWRKSNETPIRIDINVIRPEVRLSVQRTNPYTGNRSHPSFRRSDELFAKRIWPQWMNSNLWIFKDCGYQVKGVHSDSEISLLIQEAYDADRRKFEQLTHKFAVANQPSTKIDRPRIPEEVRIAVWRRDDGCCARCNSRERLEYDHIIPIVEGGSNTVRNIELLCETCNRSKGRKIQ